MTLKSQDTNVENTSPRVYLYGFLTALRFLTVFPVSWHADKDGENFKGSLIWFPVIGLFIGCFCALIISILQLFLPKEIVSIITIFLLGGMSGFLHLDGLADTADGFFSSRPKERILEIMRDSRIGPMGVVILLLIILLKYSSLVNLTDEKFLVAIILTPIAGRCGALIQMALLPYARPVEKGLGGLFYSEGLKQKALLSFVFFAIMCFFLIGFQTLFVLSGFMIINILYIQYCKRKIDGATGDTLGAGCELLEVTTLVCMNIYLIY